MFVHIFIKTIPIRLKLNLVFTSERKCENFGGLKQSYLRSAFVCWTTL